MKTHIAILVSTASLALVGCQKNKTTRDEEVVSQRFIHRHGYAMSKTEWDQEQQPGQVVTTQRNGVTVASSYEGGVLHGATTETYPHSQTLRIRQIFDKGTLCKQTFFDIRGVPQKEETYLSPSDVKVISWFKNGVPKSTEEYSSGELVYGEYFNTQNELESKVDRGRGVRTLRAQAGELLSKETFEDSQVVRRETFHPNGVPQESVSFQGGRLSGEKCKFGLTGEPILRELWKNGKLDGVAVYFQNGYKYLEVPYVDGQKHGLEKQFIDGEILANETQWYHGKKHGPAISYNDGLTSTDWFYNDEKVQKRRYEELCDKAAEIAILQERSKNSSWNF
jgi:antitoxin component YwqK of YwqJK toxin-antitoxin module